ncbi:ran GTPase-activating protein 1-like [Anthonomus grandis grandis]|uniref:ran GTPase-activating protein 1-like n=1 Tax=Anthonomus grandis grandis TaxID=2921223 RepID=UPI0021666CDD|nr:ran GTPase-activating protein 1-like [Anthonomus grandis grandis]
MSKDQKKDNMDSLVEALQSTKVSSSGVSFAGKSLKLDSEEDAKPVIEEIDNCPALEYLNLEGNTLGVDAAKGIAKSLEKHPEFKKALWKDMFTGRMKTEIPKALEFLGDGLQIAGARLTELDLSDNAFGPIGVQGLAALLRSPACYALQELKLNNNGLGITGGKLLAAALTDCYNSSKNEGKALALKVFIAGRNRLENDGAKALAGVFKMIGSLEEVVMPQNGIYHIGITALSEAFVHNKGLQILNLNDNTIGEKGAEAIANALPNLQNLKEINFGDCLLKTKGALCIAKGLKAKHQNLEELILDCNEIKKQGGLALANAMANKSKLKNLVLDGNQFGEEGAADIKSKMIEIGKINTLGSLEENESEESGESDAESEEENEESEENEVEIEEIEKPSSTVSVADFLKEPSSHNFLSLGDNREQLILQEAKRNGNIEVDHYVVVLMKVAALSDSSIPKIAQLSTKITENLFKELFSWCQKNDMLSIVNNSILVNLGLIKSEDKKFKPTWNLTGCLTSLKNVSKLNFVPESTRDAIQVFVQRDIDRNGDNIELKKEVLAAFK